MLWFRELKDIFSSDLIFLCRSMQIDNIFLESENVVKLLKKKPL